MHYRNGRPAKNGDKVVQFYLDTGMVVGCGVLYDATPGNDYCNGRIAPMQANQEIACLIDCIHIEDLAKILKEKGLGNRPVTKTEEVGKV